MKILITGGAGFIGSHLADRLLREGHHVHVIDNFQTARRDSLTPHKNLTVTEATIAQVDVINEIFAEFKPDQVIHAAASYKDPENWNEDILTNVMGTIHVVKAAKIHNIKRMIYFQTSLCYGLKPVEQPITLHHPLFSGTYSGGSSYAISKASGELYIELSGLDFISFRLANAYGPRNLSGPIPTFYNRLKNNLPCYVVDTRRDFIYIDDLVEVVMKALYGRGEKGFYHVSSGSDYSIKELYDAIVKAMGIKLEKEVEVRPRSQNDVFTILLDPLKTYEDFDWAVTTSLEVGIKSAVEWYKTHGVTQTFTHLKYKE